MKRLFMVLAWLLLLGGTVRLLATPQNPANGTQPHKGATSASRAKKNLDSKEGERRFQLNCGRCHIAPEAISPREAKAVLQHMRVRASLSAEDEELILHFLAP